MQYSFSISFIEARSSWLIFESIKVLEIKPSMVFNLDFANNTVPSCFCFFFLIIVDLYFSIPATVAKSFNPIVELVIPIGITMKEAKAEIEVHPVTEEAKIRNKKVFYTT